MDLEEQKASLLSQEVPETEVHAICLRKGLTKDEVVAEAKKQLRLAGPLVCVNVLTYCLQVISVMFVGHLGELALAGASMATSFASVTGFSLLVRLYLRFDKKHLEIFEMFLFGVFRQNSKWTGISFSHLDVFLLCQMFS